MANGNETLDETIHYEGLMSISWSPRPAPLNSYELAGLNDNNLALLNAITVMEEQARRDIYDHTGRSQEMANMDAKLDLLLSLIARLLAQHEKVPPAVDVRLSSRGLRWTGGDLPVKSGDHGVMELFVHPAIAAPLKLPVRIDAAGSAAIDGLSAAVQNGLEKYIFRQHRRAVAESRQAKT